ncbi:MAG: hypothetical protein ACFFAN_04995 [Promethearchaeota archaeon]
MPREFKGIIVSRLIVLISIVLVPVIMFLIFILADFKLWFSDDPALNFWIIKILCPTVFSVSWLFFLILFANRFSETIESMDKTIGVVPLRLRFFFGVNALFILFIFVFPLITPLISILSFSSMAWRVTTFKKESWDEHKTSLITKILMVLFSIVPVFCTICIIPDYIALAIFLWESVWLPLLDYIFMISYCLCTALAIGSFFFLIANKGVSEYEQIFVDTTEQKYLWQIRILELFFFIFFLILALLELEIVVFFYYLGFFLVAIVAIVNFINGKRKDVSFKSHFLGYLLAAVFMGSNLIIFSVELAYFIQIWSLVLSAALFIFVFFYTFIKLEE